MHWRFHCLHAAQLQNCLISTRVLLIIHMNIRDLLILLVLTLYTSHVYDIFACLNRRDSGPLTYEELVVRRVTKYLPSRIKGASQRIPYIIHQTNEMDELPSDMIMAINTVQQHNPEYSYHFYNATERREFIQKHMGPTILACYDKLIPNAFKADLFRYSVVYTQGGCYTDIGFIFVRPLRDVLISSDKFVTTADGGDNNSSINSAFFCAEAGHEILFLTIKSIAGRVAASNHGEETLDITGPWAFRRGFRAYFGSQLMTFSPGYREYSNSVRLLHQQSSYGCTTYPIPDTVGDGSPILFHKYPNYGSDLAILLPGSRHYTDYWFRREVFNKSITVPADGNYLQASQ